MTEYTPALWQVGDVILDQYDVISFLGEGGMGSVFKVHHRGWNLDLAVKSPRPEAFHTERGKQDFIREAETWVNLKLHPHIVSCYYIRTLDGIPRIFAEYVAGGTLDEWIEQRRLYEGGHSRALTRMLDVAIQSAWGLHAAHLQGLVHQDVKPSNVMMTQDGVAKVTDFGLAKARVLADEGEHSMLVSHAGPMSHPYCSPEQKARHALSRKTDIWSWGVSILQMFTGERTWLLGTAAREILAGHERKDPMIPSMPASVVQLLSHCFQPSPHDRPASLLEVAHTLQQIYEQVLGHLYPRHTPHLAERGADHLNNLALSLYDLAKREEAQRVWEHALQVDRQHMETTYNLNLMLWRQGAMTDHQFMRLLEEVWVAHGKSWQATYRLAQIFLEQGDIEAALPLLQQASERSPEGTEAHDLLTHTQSADRPFGGFLRTFAGHAAQVQVVTLNADEHVALSGSLDGTIRLWDLATGQCLSVFPGHTGGVVAVSLSSDGHHLLSWDQDQTIRRWEVDTGQCLYSDRSPDPQTWEDRRPYAYRPSAPYAAHERPFLLARSQAIVSLNTDGDYILSARTSSSLTLDYLHTQGKNERESEKGSRVIGEKLILGSFPSPRHRRSFYGHTSPITAIFQSADARLAISASRDQTIRLWEIATGACLGSFVGQTESITAVCLSADGAWALSGTSVGTLHLWDVATFQCQRIFRGHTAAIRAVSLSADGHIAASGSADGTMRVWERRRDRCVRLFRGQRGGVNAVVVSADGRFVLFGSDDHTLQLCETPREQFICPLLLSQVWSHAEVARTETQAIALIQQAEHALSEGQFLSAITLVRQLRLLPGWERSPRSIQMWATLARYCLKVGIRTGWALRTFVGHTSAVNAVCLSPDARLALSGSSDKTMRLWDIATGQCLRTFVGQTAAVNAVCLSADARLAISGSADAGREGNTLSVWELSSGQCLRTFVAHSTSVRSVCLTTDGRYALSGSDDHTMGLWEVSSGRCLHIFQDHTSSVNAVCLSADGRFALSGSSDRTMRLWDIATGRCLHIFQGHTRDIRSVCVSADGCWILSGSEDGTVRLWDIATERCLHIFQGHTDGVSSLSWSADGSIILSGSGDQTARVWKLDWELEAHVPTPRDEQVLPLLETFLIQQTPYAGVLPQRTMLFPWEIRRALSRHGKPAWSEQDVRTFLEHLQHAGYGWLHPEEVKRMLEARAASWQGPTAFPHQ